MSVSMIVCGAAGRMGRTLIQLVAASDEATLVGAVEARGNDAVGADAGSIAGTGPLGVKITDDYHAIAAPENVALDFTSAEPALAHLRVAAERGAAIVIGSTGFNAAQQKEMETLAARTRTVIAPNMSVGIAVLQRLIREVATALPDFDPEIVEIHHRMKVDAPSGTALALARTVADASGRTLEKDAVHGRSGVVGKRPSNEIGVMALRGGDVVGDHTVIFAGLGERIELTHRAHSRDCLARGAIRAGLWLVGQKPGRYGMADVLGWSGAGA
jgi:4-hydroxy-tetrahydrodipicolinate reductase